MHRKLLAATAVLVVALALFLTLRPGETAKPASEPEVATSAPQAWPPSPEERPDVPTAVAKNQKPDDADSRRVRREQLVQALSTAQQRRLRDVAARASLPTGPEEPSATKLDITNKVGSESDWEQRQLEVLRELLGECYDLAAAEQPGLAGNIGIQFTIQGEPEVGGLVNEVSIMESYSTIADPNMRECMTQSIYSLELDPPPEGLLVGREITLRFDAPE